MNDNRILKMQQIRFLQNSLSAFQKEQVLTIL